MKVIEVITVDSGYRVTTKPSFLGRLFGAKFKREIYHSTNSTYSFGGGGIYIDSKGYKTGNGSIIGEAIDRHIRVEEINKKYKLTKEDILRGPQFDTSALENYVGELKENEKLKQQLWKEQQQ